MKIHVYFLMYLFLCLPDIDECSQSESPCTKDNQECVNSNGSYVCICSHGYEEEDGECVQTQQPGGNKKNGRSHTICVFTSFLKLKDVETIENTLWFYSNILK